MFIHFPIVAWELVVHSISRLVVAELPHVMNYHVGAFGPFSPLAFQARRHFTQFDLADNELKQAGDSDLLPICKLERLDKFCFSAVSSSSSDTSWTSTCLVDTGFGYGNCNRLGDPVHVIYPNPYGTSSFPSVFSENSSLAAFVHRCLLTTTISSWQLALSLLPRIPDIRPILMDLQAYSTRWLLIPPKT